MKALFVFAHPDDESFAAGGTIALLVKKGAEVVLATATRGEAGKCGEPPLCSQEELGGVRELELRAACKILGVSKLQFLDFHDGTLHNISASQLEEKIRHVIEKEKPDAVVTFDETGITNHPDHIAVSRATTAACQPTIPLYHAAFPASEVAKFENDIIHAVFGRVNGTPDEAITTRVDIGRAIEQKKQALACHKTQHRDLYKYLDGAMNSIMSVECFKLVQGHDALQQMIKGAS